MSLFASIPGGNYVVKPQTGFSSALMDKLVLSRSKIEEWVQHEKAKAEQVAEEYRQHLMQEKAEIERKRASLLAVQLERGLSVQADGDENDKSESIAKRKNALEEQQSMLESEIEKLEEEFKSREKRVYDVTEEEAKQRQRALSARKIKQQVEDAKRTTIDDLTRGIMNYKHTGLDFERTNVENELRFNFINLDPKYPARKFSFLLRVNDKDKYEIGECMPTLDVGILIEIAAKLNETDEMSYLVRKMRRAFLDSL